MKVLMVAPGTSPHAWRPLAWLLARGVEVVFLDEVDPLAAGAPGYRFVPLPRSGLAVLRRLVGSRIALALAKWRAWPLRRLWQRERPDVVHVHWVDPRAQHCAAAGMHPLVLTVWGSDVNDLLDPGANPAMRAAIGEALAAADLVCIDGADMAEKCAQLAGRPVPTRLLTLGVDTKRFAPGWAEEAAHLRHWLDIAPGTRVVLSPRAMAGLYRHHEVLEAFAAAGVPDAVLVFIRYNPGNFADCQVLEAELRDHAARLGVADALRFCDRLAVELLPALYNAADVVVNFPARDAFPVTFLEALACARPVITCPHHSYAGTVAERHARFVNDVPGLASALADTLAHPPALSAARDEVIRLHDEALVADTLVAWYRELCATP
jgi:glycosyltransferase involved in cell wall biosynthesis